MFNKYSELRAIIENKNDCISEECAFFTHYLQNYGSDSEKYYRETGLKFLMNNFYGYEDTSNGKKDIVSEPSQLKLNFDNKFWDVPFPPPKDPDFTFIDLFAGIGGFRIAFQNLNGKCVFSSEIDKYSQKVYESNFGEIPFGDITKIDEKQIPEHDILLAGFPCQAFSIAGRRAGFEDTRGTLFFDIARILKEKKPKAFFLENVKGLVNHQRGKTLSRILDVLRNDLNYYVPEPRIMNAKHFGVPQNRERIFIIGFRKDLNINEFEYPAPKTQNVCFKNVKEKKEVSVKYYLSTQYLQTLRNHRKRHENKGNGFGFEIVQDNNVANAILVGGMGRERNLVVDCRLSDFTPVTNIKGEVNKEGIRRMTPREWARLQGFPDSFRIDLVADAQLYKQFGNSVAIPAIQATGEKLIKRLKKDA